MIDQTQPNNVSETQPNNVSEAQPNNVSETQPNKVSNPQPGPVKRNFRAGFWIGLLVLIVALGLGGMTGYNQGVDERISAKGTLVSKQLGEQFTLVQQDIDAKRYSVARQRLEYIIKQDPSFPGAANKLADVMVAQAITPTAVPTDTPTLTPTPDMRSQETIFAQAGQQLLAKDWSGLMTSLDSLRKADPTYKAVFVDGMYYTALRNRGVDQILGGGAYKITNMEGGIYDLTIAERFGPLDGYADGLRNFSRMYIAAASFWDVNWQQAVEAFRVVYQYTPNLRDASNITAGQRLYQALLQYGDEVAANTKPSDRCHAVDLWSEASKITALDNVYAAKYNNLNLECHPPTGEPTIGVPTETPTQEGPPLPTKVRKPTKTPSEIPPTPTETPVTPAP
jgi:hypothetical protein